MKIRLMGSPDLIQLWANELKKAYGITGKTYPNRNNHEVRYYVDLDDRKAEAVLKKQQPLNNQHIEKCVQIKTD